MFSHCSVNDQREYSPHTPSTTELTTCKPPALLLHSCHVSRHQRYNNAQLLSARFVPVSPFPPLTFHNKVTLSTNNVIPMSHCSPLSLHQCRSHCPTLMLHHPSTKVFTVRVCRSGSKLSSRSNLPFGSANPGLTFRLGLPIRV